MAKKEGKWTIDGPTEICPPSPEILMASVPPRQRIALGTHAPDELEEATVAYPKELNIRSAFAGIERPMTTPPVTTPTTEIFKRVRQVKTQDLPLTPSPESGDFDSVHTMVDVPYPEPVMPSKLARLALDPFDALDESDADPFDLTGETKALRPVGKSERSSVRALSAEPALPHLPPHGSAERKPGHGFAEVEQHLSFADEEILIEIPTTGLIKTRSRKSLLGTVLRTLACWCIGASAVFAALYTIFTTASPVLVVAIAAGISSTIVGVAVFRRRSLAPLAAFAATGFLGHATLEANWLYLPAAQAALAVAVALALISLVAERLEA